MIKETTIITGANSNIGSYIAQKLINKDEGLLLFFHKNRKRIDNLKLRSKNQVKIIEYDLESPTSFENKLDETVQQNNLIIKKLIHTSALRSSDFLPLKKTRFEDWDKIIRVNLLGTYSVLKSVINFMQDNGGKIVLFSSNVSRIGLPNGSAYSASKAAISNLVRTIAKEEAENNILINSISPGPVKIDDSGFSEEYKQFRQEYYEDKLKNIPLKRFATLEDIYNLCDFLLSEKNCYITGEEHFITGGSL